MIDCPYCHRRHPARDMGPLAVADCPPPLLSTEACYTPVDCDQAPCPDCTWVRRHDGDPNAVVELILVSPCHRHRRSA